jgi:dihydrofolate synthase/folylpolyglutamate synthase
LTYRELLARLLPARRFGVRFGLERVRALLDALGAPDRRLGTIVHVGGTNGKGSTVAMIAAIARERGARVATYTSPHLSSLRERVTIDGAMQGEAAWARAAELVYAAPGAGELTFFELVTAIGVVLIADGGVDATVLEVGLGGRLDATNAIAAPVAVVTGVALDHEAILGDTLEAIAREKAGIFKAGQRVVIGASGDGATDTLVAAARAAGAASIDVIDDAAIARVPPLALAGAHQRVNAAAAIAAARVAGLAGDDAAIARALAGVAVPGRLERLAPDVIVDGAHNPHGARALAAALRGAMPTAPVLVVAASADKDLGAIARALASGAAAVVATRYQQDRSATPDAVAAAFAAAAPDLAIETAPDLAAALALARAKGRPIVVAGSLFVVGEARALLAGAPVDPIAVSDPPTTGR